MFINFLSNCKFSKIHVRHFEFRESDDGFAFSDLKNLYVPIFMIIQWLEKFVPQRVNEWRSNRHGSIVHQPLTAFEQWKISRHRSLWVAVALACVQINRFRCNDAVLLPSGIRCDSYSDWKSEPRILWRFCILLCSWREVGRDARPTILPWEWW